MTAAAPCCFSMNAIARSGSRDVDGDSHPVGVDAAGVDGGGDIGSQAESVFGVEDVGVADAVHSEVLLGGAGGGDGGVG